ncbi:MAG: sugar phosphate isomerase/epimerase [Armatimonadetes bacterium]|nr:sugar phosphate isomerase/epimerase [Armatimonadota bacterium]
MYRADYAGQARLTREAGFACVQLRPPYGPLNAHTCAEHIAPFVEQGLAIAAVAGYTNLVNPDLAVRERNNRRFFEMIDRCRDLGSTLIATETGSLNRESEWEDTPENHTEEAWDTLMPVLHEAVKRAEDAGVTLLIEGYVNNVVATVSDCERLRNEIPSPALGFVLDPNNLFEEADMADVSGHLERIFRAIGPWTPLVHAKDVVYREGRIDTPRAGTGQLDYAAFARLVRQYQPDAPLILEHLTQEEVPETLEYIRRYFQAEQG